MGKLLVWCGGDITRYSVVNYLFEGGNKRFRHFVSAGALFNFVKPNYLLVFIPETLFKERHGEFYKLLVKAKAGWEENGVKYVLYDEKGYLLTVSERLEVDEFIKMLNDEGKTRLVKVPHPGEGDAIYLTCEQRQGRVAVRIKRESVRGSGNFNSIMNVMFYYLSRFIEDKKNINEIHVDLTHGTNILVQALMLTSSMIRGVYDKISIRLWTAPMLKPGDIYFEDISSVLDVCSKVMIAVNTARKWLDDRLVEDSLELFKLLGRELGQKLGEVYGSTRSLTEDFRNLCWVLRSNQTVLVPEHVLSLHKKLSNVKDKALRLIHEYVENELWMRFENIEDTAWIPIVYSIVTVLDQYLAESSSVDPLEIVVKNLRLMHRCGHYIQVLLTARELIILLILVYIGVREIKVKGDLWKKLEDALLEENSADKRFKNIVSYEEFRDLESERDFFVNKLIPLFDRLKEFRNRFAHGFLIKDSIVRLGLIANWVTIDNRKINIKRIDELKSLSEEVLKLLDELMNKIKSKRESMLRQIKDTLNKYIDYVDKSYRGFQEEFRLRE